MWEAPQVPKCVALLIFLRRLAEPAYSSFMGHQPPRMQERLHPWVWD